jgi:hypothetical protein
MSTKQYLDMCLASNVRIYLDGKEITARQAMAIIKN